MRPDPDVILASGSPRRRELLGAILSRFTVEAADVPEPLGRDAVASALELAAVKAAAVARRHPDAVVIGADTIVFDDSGLYGKPASHQDAQRMLQQLRGRPHKVVTGVAVVRGTDVISAPSVSVVHLANLTDERISSYVKSGEPLDKAGAYAIQSSPPVVERWEGCFCGVMGLPLWTLAGLLAAQGVPHRLGPALPERCGSCRERPREAHPDIGP